MSVSAIFRHDLLKDKNIIVTGGGSGIGLEIVRECSRLGANLAIGARKIERLEAARDELLAAGNQAYAAALDIRDPDAVSAWVEDVSARWDGRIDVLVNNAGGQFPSPAAAIRPKGWRAVVDTNLNGTWFMTQAVGQKMMKTDGGKIINIVANMWRGFPGMAHTGAARAGVVNLTKTLSLEWARHNILVNAVAPGVIRSSGLDTYPEAVRASVETEVPKHIPLKRLGTMDDVVWSVVYLASQAGNYITGETICVDGGQAHWGTVFPV
ncbi:MAG: SDR family oxidoreductase [Myxococcota bacterium]|nr:SDR family oxidoreductase [Myxococcota bacterium]